MGFEPRRRVQFARGGGAAIHHRPYPYPTLPISQANWLARDCFSDIRLPCKATGSLHTLRHCAQDPTLTAGSFAVGRPVDAGMERHRPGTTVYLERRATGRLADLHLHLHAGLLSYNGRR